MAVKKQTREVVTIDAAGRVVGRLACEVAEILMGKNKPGCSGSYFECRQT